MACILLGGTSCARRNDTHRGPKYGDNDLEVQLPQTVLDSANCTVPDFFVPWHNDHADATIELSARQQTNGPVIRLRSVPITHVIERFEYIVTTIQKGEFPETSISFLTFDTKRDGVYYGRLILPERAKFFIKKESGKYRILSIEGETP